MGGWFLVPGNDIIWYCTEVCISALPSMEETAQNHMQSAMLHTRTCNSVAPNKWTLDTAYAYELLWECTYAHAFVLPPPPQVLNQGSEPWMTCKMYNGRVIAAWLAQCASDLAQVSPTEENILMSGCLPGPQHYINVQLWLVDHFAECA